MNKLECLIKEVLELSDGEFEEFVKRLLMELKRRSNNEGIRYPEPDGGNMFIR